jgi:hypothetical protein
MKTNDFYNEYVTHQQELWTEWVNAGKEWKEVEYWPVSFMRRQDGKIWFKLPKTIMWIVTDEGMTLKDIQDEILKDIPYVKSVQFYDETPWGAGIVI